MKINQYILLIISAVLLNTVAIGQCVDEPPRTTEPTVDIWDWRGDQKFPFYIRNENTLEGQLLEITSPFFANNNVSNPNIWYLQDDSDKDYKPEDGWELIYKNFGECCSYDAAVKVPSFALYNKYEGVLRTFFYVIDTKGEFQMATIRLFYDLETTRHESGILENSRTPVNGVSMLEKNLLPEVPNDFSQQGGYWLHADFPIAYDPCVCEVASVLTTIPVLVRTGEIVLQLEGGTTIKQIVTPAGNATSSTAFKVLFENLAKIKKDTNSVFRGKGMKISKNLKDFGPLLDAYAKDVNANGNGGTVQKYKSGIPKIPSWAKKIPEIGWVFEVADLFLAGGKKASTPKPTIFEARSEFKAMDSEISFESEYGGNNFYTPGSKEGGDVEAAIPVYDNPLGVMTFVHPPKIKTQRTDSRFLYQLFDAEYAVNHKAGIYLKEIKGALFFDACSESQVSSPQLKSLGFDTDQQIVKSYEKSDGRLHDKLNDNDK